MTGPISRLTLPENFFDTTSSMLLLQPEPQYILASLWKRAMAASLTVPNTIGIAGREIQGVGGAYSSAAAGRLTIADDLFDGLFAAKFDMKGMPGHTVRVNRPKYSDTTYTKASRAIGTNTSISTTPIAIGSEQNDITLRRYAGPYDQANSRVAPFGLDRFDASMGVHSMVQMAGSHLQRDFDKWIDSVMVNLCENASTILYSGNATADNDATVAGQFAFDYDLINRGEESADNANVPTFGDGHRILMVTPKQARELKSDPLYAKYAEKHPEYNALFPGYLGTVNKLHVFKSTTLLKTANSSTVPVHRALILSPATFMAAMGEAPRVATPTDDNYGETQKVIWISYSETELADNRFVTQLRSA
jgi:N4-gp56 family major capsid protein